MRAVVLPAFLAAALALGAHARAADGGADAGAADAGPPPAVPSCVAISTASIYVPYGYNHVVTLANGCTRTADCDVSTDVNPEPQKVAVAAGTRAEVTTFMGSASQTFTARVACRLR